YLIPGIAIAREEQKTLVVSTANVALQDQIYSKDLPLLRKIIPALLAYRALYYFLPLLLATIGYLILESRAKHLREKNQRKLAG
ncbi:hypothetical protein QUH41_27525, partial [Klebsiella grimontii]|nr:hypothetical protein [Klebsiella grimontii]